MLRLSWELCLKKEGEFEFHCLFDYILLSLFIILLSRLYISTCRSQLCAVWVTTSTTPPPFEVLNDSVRKYDTLRLKYIKAYIDCMLVCQRKEKIENLLVWAEFSGQDLPSFYAASAAHRGGDPGKRTKQSLLHCCGFISKVKLSASNALAQLIIKDLANMKKNGVTDEGKKLLTNDFKLAYSLFLSLNSSCKNAVQFMRSKGPLIIVTALYRCYISVQAGYRINDSIHVDDMDENTLCELLEEAIAKAKEMFQPESKILLLKKAQASKPRD